MAYNTHSIRKIAVGGDYKNGAMHYVVGKDVLNGYHIHSIVESEKEFFIWVENKETSEIYLWKKLNCNMPISVEYNINF
jgi:hypothetical protein